MGLLDHMAETAFVKHSQASRTVPVNLASISSWKLVLHVNGASCLWF